MDETFVYRTVWKKLSADARQVLQAVYRADHRKRALEGSAGYKWLNYQPVDLEPTTLLQEEVGNVLNAGATFQELEEYGLIETLLEGNDSILWVQFTALGRTVITIAGRPSTSRQLQPGTLKLDEWGALVALDQAGENGILLTGEAITRPIVEKLRGYKRTGHPYSLATIVYGAGERALITANGKHFITKWQTEYRQLYPQLYPSEIKQRTATKPVEMNVAEYQRTQPLILRRWTCAVCGAQHERLMLPGNTPRYCPPDENGTPSACARQVHNRQKESSRQRRKANNSPR